VAQPTSGAIATDTAKSGETILRRIANP
jgi:hypothetical protein